MLEKISGCSGSCNVFGAWVRGRRRCSDVRSAKVFSSSISVGVTEKSDLGLGITKAQNEKKERKFKCRIKLYK